MAPSLPAARFTGSTRPSNEENARKLREKLIVYFVVMLVICQIAQKNRDFIKGFTLVLAVNRVSGSLASQPVNNRPNNIWTQPDVRSWLQKFPIIRFVPFEETP